MNSPTQLSLAHLRARGYIAEVCSYWHHFAKQRKDLFGWADIIAFDPDGTGVTLVQTTTGSNFSKRRAKILASETAKAWLAHGRMIRVDGWAKQGERGKRKVWTLRHEYIAADQFRAAQEPPGVQAEPW